ncbi:MAG: hypothetical protein JWP85_2817, partial [Rhodoglobus sp.]|nr:hypothetical protein [Rhodoglobus sp.]
FECWLAIDAKSREAYHLMYTRIGFSESDQNDFEIYYTYRSDEEKAINIAENSEEIKQEESPNNNDFLIVETATALKFVKLVSDDDYESDE